VDAIADPGGAGTEKPTVTVGKIPDLSTGISRPVSVGFRPVIRIRAHGAPSVAQGRTPHEVRDELCRDAGAGRV
jgi:hypothetical protein